MAISVAFAFLGLFHATRGLFMSYALVFQDTRMALAVAFAINSSIIASICVSLIERRETSRRSHISPADISPIDERRQKRAVGLESARVAHFCTRELPDFLSRHTSIVPRARVRAGERYVYWCSSMTSTRNVLYVHSADALCVGHHVCMQRAHTDLSTRTALSRQRTACA